MGQAVGLQGMEALEIEQGIDEARGGGIAVVNRDQIGTKRIAEIGIVAQRLVRTVCAQCRVETFLTPDQMTLLGLDVHELQAQGQDPQLMVAFGEGCVQCRSTGLLGRTGVFEILEIDDKLRKLIIAKASAKEITKQARHDGLLTLREAAIKKLAKGQTSFEEVLRVTTEG